MADVPVEAAGAPPFTSLTLSDPPLRSSPLRAHCSRMVQVLGPDDAAAIMLRIFPRYLALTRRLQHMYRLEPAGSHGVWGLDDFSFLPFVWGSAQLVQHRHIRPKSIQSAEVMEGYAVEYMYLGAICEILRVKSSQATFAEHSPILHDISGLKTWAEVHEGFLRMYCSEVLHKLPVVQHFLFGSILPANFVARHVELGQGSAHGHGEGSQFEEHFPSSPRRRLVPLSTCHYSDDCGCCSVPSSPKLSAFGNPTVPQSRLEVLPSLSHVVLRVPTCVPVWQLAVQVTGVAPWADHNAPTATFARFAQHEEYSTLPDELRL